MESVPKRKRDLDCPRITFQASGRTFDRLFREDSLAQLQQAVRKKLGLQPDALVKLAQIRGAVDVDLEDEDDFDAFYNAVHSTSSARVRVTVPGNGVVKDVGNDKPVATPARKKRKLTASQTPASGAMETTPIATPSLPAKRAASPATESSEDANEPPSKRVRVSSPHPPAKPLENHATQRKEAAKQSSAPTNGKSVPETVTTVSPSLTSPAPNPPAPVEKTGTDGKKPAKPKAKKSLDFSSSSLGVKTRDEVLEEQAKAERELKKKEKSLKKERRKAGNDSPTLASTKGGDGPKDTSSKGKKAKASENEKRAMPESGKQKKVVKSKAQVQEATSDEVDSETNDVLDLNVQNKDSLANISLSIIEKYLTPQVSTTEAGSKDSASVVQNTPKVPTCPYCGKSLTHDRSHCPLLRTKLVHTIEQRLEELKANDDEDPEVRSNAISALEAALQRRRPTIRDKESVPVPAKSHPESTPPVISTPPIIKPTPRPKSPTSGESSSEDDDESADEDEPPKHDKTSRVSVQPGPSDGVSARTSPFLTSQSLHDDTNAGDSSEDDTPPPGTGIKPKSIPFRPPHDDDSESSSSDNESIHVAASHGQGLPKSQPTRPTTHASSMNGGNDYDDEDLEALIRGPGVPFKSADLPSSDSSEDEESEGVRLDNESEQESNFRSRKNAPSFAVDRDSSDDDDEGDEEHEREPPRKLSVNLVPPPVATSNAVSHSTDDPNTEASQEKALVQQVNRRLGSELYRSGNDDLEDVRARESASLRLPGKELTPPTMQKPSDPLVALALHSQSHDQLEKEERLVEDSNLQINGKTPDVMQQDPEREQPPDLVGSIDASDAVPGVEPRSTTEAVNDNEGPSSPPPHTQETEPREEPARASTPKPAMIQRMRGRAARTPATQKPATPLSLNQAAVAKPSTRKPALRTQSKSTNKNQSVEFHQNEDDADAEPVAPKVKAAPKKSAAHTTKTPLTRTKFTVEKKADVIEGDKEPDPPLRRSQRVSSKPPSVTPEVLHANLLPLGRPTRLTSTIPTSKEIIESHPPKNSTRVVQRSKKVEANVSVDPSLPLPESKGSDTVVSGSQPGGPNALCPPSPPVSLNAWETLVPETPVGTTHSDAMIDELHSDMDPIPFPLKPQHRRKTSFGRKESHPRLEQVSQNVQDRTEEGEKRNEKALFIPSESQTVFPHSQFQMDSPELGDGKSSDSEEEVRATVANNKASRSQSAQPSRYRKLSDFASQATKLFTPKILRQAPSLLSNSSKRPNTQKDRLDQLYGKMGRRDSDDIESDDGSGHDSDSDASKTSHIPKSRKAGAAPKGRKSLA